MRGHGESIARDTRGRPRGLIVALVTWLGVAAAATALASPEAFKALELGTPAPPRVAPDFTLPRLAGGTIAMKDFRGRPVIVNFWTTWCQPCLVEMPALDRLYRANRGRGLVVLGISLDRSEDVVAQFVRQMDITFPIALDPEWQVADRFRVLGLPGTFVVGADGLVKGLGFGPREWDGRHAQTLADWLLSPR